MRAIYTVYGKVIIIDVEKQKPEGFQIFLFSNQVLNDKIEPLTKQTIANIIVL